LTALRMDMQRMTAGKREAEARAADYRARYEAAQRQLAALENGAPSTLDGPVAAAPQPPEWCANRSVAAG
jgi:hypothetical protein